MLAALAHTIRRAEATASEARDEESLLGMQGGDQKRGGNVEQGRDHYRWCYWVLSMAALLLCVMWQYSEWYVGRMTDGEDTGGGWAGDFLILVVAVSFIISSKHVVSDKYVIFYWGTAVAYGLGGVGHFLEGSSDASMVIGYYISMTLAFGGDAVRAGWGYALPSSPAVMAQRVFTFCAYGALCAFALWNLKLVLVDDTSKEDLAVSTAGRMYKATQILMGVVEASGSIVWYGITRPQLEGRPLRLVATAINVAAWTLVKTMPLMFAKQGITTTVAHRLPHYCQYIIMWVMHTLTTKGYVNSTTRLQHAPGASAPLVKQGEVLLGHAASTDSASAGGGACAAK